MPDHEFVEPVELVLRRGFFRVRRDDLDNPKPFSAVGNLRRLRDNLDNVARRFRGDRRLPFERELRSGVNPFFTTPACDASMRKRHQQGFKTCSD